MGYDIYWNLAREERGDLIASDWAKSKAEAKRKVEGIFEVIQKGHRVPLAVLAVDPRTGDVVAGKVEVQA